MHESITLQQAAGYGLNIKRRNCHCEEPWAKSKGTKQSKLDSSLRNDTLCQIASRSLHWAKRTCSQWQYSIVETLCPLLNLIIHLKSILQDSSLFIVKINWHYVKAQIFWFDFLFFQINISRSQESSLFPTCNGFLWQSKVLRWTGLNLNKANNTFILSDYIYLTLLAPKVLFNNTIPIFF